MYVTPLMTNKEFVEITTAHHVKIRFDTAGIGDRVSAYLIDVLICFAISVGIFLIFTSLNLLGNSSMLLYFFLILLYSPWIFYHLLAEVFFNGQSFGKMQRKIKVMRMDGTEAHLSNYLIRWLLRPVDVVFFGIVGIIAIAASNRGQRVGDMAAGTTVIKVNQPIQLKDILWFDDTEKQKYQAVYPQAAKLSDNDIRLIKTTLNEYEKTGKAERVIALAEKVRAVLEIQNRESSSLIFLKRIIQDHTELMVEMAENQKIV